MNCGCDRNGCDTCILEDGCGCYGSITVDSVGGYGSNTSESEHHGEHWR